MIVTTISFSSIVLLSFFNVAVTVTSPTATAVTVVDKPLAELIVAFVLSLSLIFHSTL